MVKLLNRKIAGLPPLFFAVVAVPVLCSTLYYGIFASDVYVSEARFVIKSPDKPSGSGLGVLLKSAGFANAGDEIYAAHDYMLSRDALKTLNADKMVETAYGNASVSMLDRFDPLGMASSFEDLFDYYKKKVKVDYDTTSSITTLTVRAYSPQDAQAINARLLEQAEGLVNRMNVRGRQDLITFAQKEVDEAQQRSRAAALALAAYRNTEGVVDPEKQAAVQLQMIAKLQDELIASKTQLFQLRSLTPANPQIPALQARIKNLGEEIDDQLGMVAGNRRSLAASASEYQRRLLESQFAERQLAGAMASLQDARNEARRKQAYVERIVQPSRPDKALEPRRLRSIFATLVVALAAWSVLTMLLAGVREHRD